MSTMLNVIQYLNHLFGYSKGGWQKNSATLPSSLKDWQHCSLKILTNLVILPRLQIKLDLIKQLKALYEKQLFFNT